MDGRCRIMGMIDELHVTDLALIEDATLSPSPRMTVLTGETGAGKTALLSACRLAMGHRADKSIVREGSPEALCEIRLFAHGKDGEGSEIVASRKVTSDGRSRCKIDGSMASVTELASAIAPHIDLCSQHDQQLLTSASTQRALLDMWAGVVENGVMSAYKKAFADVREKSDRLDEVMASAQASDERLQDAKRVFMQISSLDPSDEDYEQISDSLKKSENSELLARTSSEASASLSDEGGALDALNAAVSLLEEGGCADESLTGIADALREAVYIAEDVARDVSSYSSSIELDVGELEFMQERMAAYQSILRTYGPELSNVYEAKRQAASVIDAVENADRTLEDARRELEEAKTLLGDAAEALRVERAKAAPLFSKAANKVLDKLNMQGARIDFQIKELSTQAWTEDGPDDVRMMFVPAKGMQPRQLSRIASGGELSRVMLAIRAAMGERDDVDTLIFDEIDAGVGGESAKAISDVLSELADSHQVIVVTHLPQIAAKADCHYLVEKESGEDMARTILHEIASDDRVHEIARMLSGTITESSLAHAKELLSM